MRIGVDQDDTICWWGKHKDRTLRANYPHLSNFKFGELQTSWDLYEGLDEAHSAAMTATMNDPTFYEGFDVIEGAAEALNAMVDEGHEVFIVSTPWVDNVNCMNAKYHWLEKNIGPGWGKRLILTHDKTVINLDLLIDDKPQITGVMAPTWEQVLFTQPHNASVEGKRRLEDWAHWRTVVDGPDIPLQPPARFLRPTRRATRKLASTH